MFSSRQDDMGSSLTALQRKTIASLESRIEQIALLPSVVARLAALDFDSPTAPDEVVALIRSDPPLSLRLMRLANSSVAGGGGIDTISGAILRVGVQGLAGLVLALSVVEVSYPTREANGTFGFIPSKLPWLLGGWPQRDRHRRCSKSPTPRRSNSPRKLPGLRAAARGSNTNDRWAKQVFRYAWCRAHFQSFSFASKAISVSALVTTTTSVRPREYSNSREKRSSPHGVRFFSSSPTNSSTSFCSVAKVICVRVLFAPACSIQPHRLRA